MLEELLSLMSEWRKVFPRKRTSERAITQAISSVCALGRRTIARSYLVRGGASCLDLIRILRDEVVVYPELLPSQAKITEKLMLATATI